MIAFLNQHEASFGMIIDKKKLVFKTLLKKEDTLGAINELLSILKFNFENVAGEFQSIYDHHEILISLMVDLCKQQGMLIDEDFIISQLESQVLSNDDDLFISISADSVNADTLKS